MSKLIGSLLIALLSGVTLCLGQTYLVRHQSFLDNKNIELACYDAYDQSKPDLIVLVLIDAASHRLR